MFELFRLFSSQGFLTIQSVRLNLENYSVHNTLINIKIHIPAIGITYLFISPGERPYKCDVPECGRSFAQLSNLNHHKKNHEEHVKRDIARHFRCEVCDRSYATKQSLNTHIQKVSFVGMIYIFFYLI